MEKGRAKVRTSPGLNRLDGPGASFRVWWDCRDAVRYRARPRHLGSVGLAGSTAQRLFGHGKVPCANALVSLMAGAGILFLGGAPASAATRTYDGAGRLARVETDGVVVEYRYDGSNNPVKRCQQGVCTDLMVDQALEYPKVVGSINGGPTQPDIVFAYGPNGLDAKQAGNEVSYALVDEQETIRGYANAAGAVPERASYTAFGKVRSSTGASSAALGLGYAGEVQDAKSGDVWLRARTYDPDAGRFVQRDSFEGLSSRAASLNRYTYAENNPVNYADPSGNLAFIPAALWTLGTIGTIVGALTIWDAGRAPANAPGPCDSALSDDVNGNPYLNMATAGAASLLFAGAVQGGLGLVRGAWSPVGELLRGFGRLRNPGSYVPRNWTPPPGWRGVVVTSKDATHIPHAQVYLVDDGAVIAGKGVGRTSPTNGTFNHDYGHYGGGPNDIGPGFTGFPTGHNPLYAIPASKLNGSLQNNWRQIGAMADQRKGQIYSLPLGGNAVNKALAFGKPTGPFGAVVEATEGACEMGNCRTFAIRDVMRLVK